MPLLVSRVMTTRRIGLPSSGVTQPRIVGEQRAGRAAGAAGAPGSGTPTGNVTVSDGAASCTATVAAGQCALALTSTGARSLTAAYAGDASFNPSTSAERTHAVDAATTNDDAQPLMLRIRRSSARP